MEGLRYVEDGNVVSSAGATSGIDATLHVLQRKFGREIAVRKAARIGYPYLHYLDAPNFELVSPNPVLPYLAGLFGRTSDAGVLLYDGVGELSLSSVIDTYPRSHAIELHPIGETRAPIRTRYGLTVLPRHDFTDAPVSDELFVPGERPPGKVLQAWSRTGRGTPTARVHGGTDSVGRFAFDLTLADIARRQAPGLALHAAYGLEYPVRHLEVAGLHWFTRSSSRTLYGMRSRALGCQLQVQLARPRSEPTCRLRVPSAYSRSRVQAGGWKPGLGEPASVRPEVRVLPGSLSE